MSQQFRMMVISNLWQLETTGVLSGYSINIYAYTVGEQPKNIVNGKDKSKVTEK